MIEIVDDERYNGITFNIEKRHIMNPSSLNTPQQITETMIRAGVTKVKASPGKMILLGIFTGMFIACGADGSSSERCDR